MEQVIEAVRQAETDLDQAWGNSAEVGTLQRAAEAWATHALRTFTGDHLRAALGISAALSEFVAVEEAVRGHSMRGNRP